MNKFILLVFLIFAIGCNNNQVNSQIKIKKEIKAKRAKIKGTDLEYLNRYIDSCKLLSMDELKNEVTVTIQNITLHTKYLKERNEQLIVKNKTTYKAEDEEFDNSPIELNFMQNDSGYMAYMQKGFYFGQHLKENKNYLYAISNLTNKYLKKKTYSKNRRNVSVTTIFTSPKLHPKSKKDLYLKKIYYKNGKVEENVTSDWCWKYNLFASECKIDRKYPIDSMLLNYSISTISKYDTLVITPQDTNKTIDDIVVKEFSENYVLLSINKKAVYKNIIEIEAYNKDNKPLDTKRASTNISYSFEKLDKHIYEYNLLDKKIQKMNNKKTALLLIENMLLDSYFKDTARLYNKQLFYKGNVDKVLIYRKQERHKKEFEVMCRNAMPKQKFFANPFDDRTEILNPKGEVIKTIPIKELEFIHEKAISADRGLINTNYLIHNDTSYYFNNVNKKLTKLNKYSSIRYLTPDLIKAYDKKKHGLTILDNNMNKIIDTTYNIIELNGDIIKAKNYYQKYIILDKKGKCISPQEFHYISPNYKDLYKVAVVEPHTFKYKEGFINSKGKWIVKPEYEYLNTTYKKDNVNFKGELQIVGKHGYGYGLVNLDKKAKLTVPCKYENLIYINKTKGKLYIAKLNDNYGIIDINNSIIHPLKYSKEEVEKLAKENVF